MTDGFGDLFMSRDRCPQCGGRQSTVTGGWYHQYPCVVTTNATSVPIAFLPPVTESTDPTKD